MGIGHPFKADGENGVFFGERFRSLVEQSGLSVLSPAVDAELLVVVDHFLDLGDAVADINHVVPIGETRAGNVETLDHDVNLHIPMQKCRVGHSSTMHHTLWGA